MFINYASNIFNKSIEKGLPELYNYFEVCIKRRIMPKWQKNACFPRILNPVRAYDPRKERLMKENQTTDVKTEEKSTTGHKILTIVGIVICVILVPILVINVIMIIKGLVNKDEVPTIGGYAPLIVLTDSMNPPTSEDFKALYPIDMTFDEKVKEGLRAEIEQITLERTEKERILKVSIGSETENIKKIQSGDLIVIKKIKAEDVKIGDVISFFDPEAGGTAVVTHRVIALEYDEKTGALVSFRTRGDNNNSADFTSIPVGNLVGIWTGKTFTGIGSVAMFMQSTPGLIVCIAVPIVLLVGYEILRRRKYDSSKKKDTDALLKELEELRRLKEQQEAQKAELTQPEGPDQQ